jgi:hypothetical protein
MLEAQPTCLPADLDPLSSTPMFPGVAASAAAARALGYYGVANLIEDELLTPARIASMSRVSASKGAIRDFVVIILAHGLGRPHGWTGDVERSLALDALAAEPDPAATLATLAELASRIVSKHWPEIAPAA